MNKYTYMERFQSPRNKTGLTKSMKKWCKWDYKRSSGKPDVQPFRRTAFKRLAQKEVEEELQWVD